MIGLECLTSMSKSTYGEFHKNVAELTRLAAAQIRVSITESGTSVDVLSLAFTEIVNHERMLRDSIELLPDQPEVKAIKQSIQQLSNSITLHVQNAVIAFQFYDRLCQRLDHTSECLRLLSEIEDRESVNDVLKLRDNVYNHFTMKEERQLFDAILSNTDFEEAIVLYNEARDKSLTEDQTDDIELF